MEYVIPLVLVALVATAVIVLLVNRATAKRTASARDESGGPGIGADSATPLGDTPEHAGVQTPEGQTVAGQDALIHGGTGRPAGVYTGSSASDGDGGETGAERFARHEDAEHVKAEGEAEGSSRIQ